MGLLRGAVRLLVVYVSLTSVGLAGLAWTPIHPASNNQIDLWTLRDSGCPCPFDASLRTCACCSVDGGCPCGRQQPSRCAQCGLQQHCDNMCNMTLDSQTLDSSSGKKYGQLKMVAATSPLYCWYRFRGEPGTRIEVQVYRMVRSGKWSNVTGCSGGGLVFYAGVRLNSSTESSRTVCGENSRFSPPVTLLVDSLDAVMEYRVTEQTDRALFMAFFSFSPHKSQYVAVENRGGRPLRHSECDWLYQDLECVEKSSCVLASPGYPGTYPPNTRCKYFIFINKVSTEVKIDLTLMDLPVQFCASHYLTVYGGSTVASPKLATMCGDNTTTIHYRGPKLLVEFSSGVPVAPFSYGGFLASLEVTAVRSGPRRPGPSLGAVAPSVSPADDPPGETAGAPPAGTAPDQQPSLLLNEASAGRVRGCNLMFSGHRRRSGFFSADTSCNFTFQGRPSDLVVVSLLNYRLRGEQCAGALEVHGDGFYSDEVGSRHCSPAYRTVRDSLGRASVAKKIWSSSNKMLITFRPQSSPHGDDFVEGAYMFHNADSEGHLIARRICHAETDAEVSARSGQVTMPQGVPLLWDLEGPLVCQHKFRVQGRSLRIQVTSPDGTPARYGTQHCLTRCTGNRCRCLVDLVALSDVDHLQLLTRDGRPIACLCGNFSAALPLTLNTNSDILVSYNVAHFMWAAVGPNFTLRYRFGEPSCPPLQPRAVHGLLSPILPSLAPTSVATHEFNFFRCSWTFPNTTEPKRTLTLEPTAGPGGGSRCRQLNVSVTSLGRGVHGLDELLDVYCGGQGRRSVRLRAGSNHTVSLTTLGPSADTFRLWWKLEVRSIAAPALSSPPALFRWVWWTLLLLSVGIT